MLVHRLRGRIPELIQIPNNIGTIIGDMNSVDEYGGTIDMTGAFDSNPATVNNKAGWTGFAYIGKKWSSPKIIGRFVATGYNLGAGYWSHASQSSINGFKFQGSNDTTNGIDGTWTDLYSNQFENHDETSAIIDQSYVDSTTPYLAHRFFIRNVSFDGISIGALNFSITQLDLYEWD